MQMRNMGRAACWTCAAALLAVSGCSSSKKNGGSSIVAAGGGPFGNAPGSTTGQGGKAGSPGTGTGTGTGTSGTSALGGGKCAEGLAHGGHQTPRVVIVADGSCSMSTNYPADGNPDATRCMNNPNGRWAALRKGLVDATAGVVTTLTGGVEFGLVVFGTQGTNGCPIPETPIDPALNNLQAITNALPQVQPGMYTPTGAALDWVYANMFNAAPTPDQHAGPQIVILATDGQPNSCNDATPNFQPTIDAVTTGAGKGIKTYVISLAAGSGQYHDFLQQIANIGALAAQGTTSQLYEPTTPADLTAALEQLVGGAIGCDLALDGSVVMGRECEGTVELNGNALPCNNANGWVLADPRHVRLQGTACDQLKKSADAMLDARFPCAVYKVQ
jgi:hypothetical protein